VGVYRSVCGDGGERNLEGREDSHESEAAYKDRLSGGLSFLLGGSIYCGQLVEIHCESFRYSL